MNPFLSNVERFDLKIVGGEGARLCDVYGNWYLDFWGDESTQGLGYGPAVNDAIRAFLDSGHPHQLPDVYTNVLRTNAALRLLSAYGFDRIFFSNSGAEAIETAIKAVRRYWRVKGLSKKRVCYTVKGNFHGRTLGALMLSDSIGSGSPYHKEAFGIVSGEDYGVIDPSTDDLERIDPEQTAAIFMAPVLGNNCVKVYPRSWIDALRRWCNTNDVLLVFDEIQSGSGWTGRYSAAQMYGVQPDVMTLGKRMALGFPASATLFREDVGASIGYGEHFNTFAGSPFVAHMICAWLDWLESGGLRAIKETGAYIADGLRERSWIRKVNAAGMMISFLPDIDVLRKSSAQLCEEARRLGLLIVTHRPFGEIRFTPPCNILKRDIDEAFRLLDEAASS